ncbi:MAG: hypothetical protein D6734_12440 [Candidatus Schekmanbacteria bacterium]|nr:MAG: hypothetical protein D6734_12440 [Candidatus Schekmanbacteria bacterium]
MNDNRLKLISQKVQLYQKIQDIASEERKEAARSNYTRILFLQEMRQQILNQIEKLDKTIETQSKDKQGVGGKKFKSKEESEAQGKVISLIKNILKIDEETLKVVNAHRDETLKKIKSIGDAKKQIEGYGGKKVKKSKIIDGSI